MKTKLSLILNIAALICPILSIFIMCFFEKEFNESLVSGLMIGCAIGTVLDIVALALNREKHKVLKIVSLIILTLPLVVLLVLTVPYLLFNVI